MPLPFHTQEQRPFWIPPAVWEQMKAAGAAGRQSQGEAGGSTPGISEEQSAAEAADKGLQGGGFPWVMVGALLVLAAFVFYVQRRKKRKT